MLWLSQGEEAYRIVYQFHYVAWPDFGVPSNASQLLRFRRRVLSSIAPHSGKQKNSICSLMSDEYSRKLHFTLFIAASIYVLLRGFVSEMMFILVRCIIKNVQAMSATGISLIKEQFNCFVNTILKPKGSGEGRNRI